jgi:hypothetical protein
MKNLLEICIDEFAHSNNKPYMEQKMSFEQLLVFTKFFFKWNNFTSDYLWEIYNSENKEIITDIPLIKEFLKDCSNDNEIERLIRSLA